MEDLECVVGLIQSSIIVVIGIFIAIILCLEKRKEIVANTTIKNNIAENWRLKNKYHFLGGRNV